MNTLGMDVSECDAIAVSAGPGSFTGLRIGSATAKGIGLALNLPIIEVPTVDAIAYNLFGTDRIVCPLMDARRQQVYTGLYTFEGSEMKVLCPQKAVSIDEILEKLMHLTDTRSRVGTEWQYIRMPSRRNVQCRGALRRPMPLSNEAEPWRLWRQITGRINRSVWSVPEIINRIIFVSLRLSGSWPPRWLLEKRQRNKS